MTIAFASMTCYVIARSVATWQSRRALLFLFALAALAFGKELVCNAADDATENRGDPEEPERLDGGPANENCHCGRAGRVHRRVGHRDRDEVDEREAEADGNRGAYTRG